MTASCRRHLAKQQRPVYPSSGTTRACSLGVLANENLTRQPFRLTEFQTVRSGECTALYKILTIGLNHLRQYVEEVSKPAGRADDLYHPRANGAGVPHRVHPAARLGDVPTGSKDHLAIARAEPDLSLGDDRLIPTPGNTCSSNSRAARVQY